MLEVERQPLDGGLEGRLQHTTKFDCQPRQHNNRHLKTTSVSLLH